jgi:D-3-phosphoglycerate dehydrogenase / 2-oxoglutarate reductase
MLLKLNVKCVLISIMVGWARFVLYLLLVVLFCSGLNAHPIMINSKVKISIIDDFHPLFVERLSAYFDVEYIPEISQSEVVNSVSSSQIIAVRSKVRFDKLLIDQLPNLKCIARGGAGMDNIDTEYAEEQSIVLLNAPEGNRDAVAEHCLGLLLALSNNIVKSQREMLEFKFDREGNRGWEIGGKTIGIFGYGNTGCAFARKLMGFDCKIIAYDKFHQNNPFDYVKMVDFETILKESDIISFHIPLTKQTSQMINSDFINHCKQGVVMLNTSRGGIVNQEDLLSGINSGKIKQYGTDVLENENFEYLTSVEKEKIMLLMSNNQVIVTPHVAGWSGESYYKIADVLSEKIIKFSIK